MQRSGMGQLMSVLIPTDRREGGCKVGTERRREFSLDHRASGLAAKSLRPQMRKINKWVVISEQTSKPETSKAQAVGTFLLQTPPSLSQLRAATPQLPSRQGCWEPSKMHTWVVQRTKDREP